MLGDLLMTFFEVARQGSITMAARQLRVSQPTVTGRIRQNLGASVVPLGEVPQDPLLRVVPFARGAPVLNEYLYCLRSRRGTRLVGAFLACLTATDAATDAAADAAAEPQAA